MLDRIFDPENKFWTFANKMADMVVLGFLWLIASLPLVTVGAACSAFWRMTLDLARDEESRLLSGFFRAFRACLPTGIAAGLTHLALSGFLIFDGLLCLRMNTQAGAFLAGLFGALLLLLALVSVWLYPLVGARGMRWREAVVNACLLAIRHLLHSLACLVLSGLALAVCVYLPYAILFLPAIACYGSAKIINRILGRYDPPEEESERR